MGNLVLRITPIRFQEIFQFSIETFSKYFKFRKDAQASRSLQSVAILSWPLGSAFPSSLCSSSPFRLQGSHSLSFPNDCDFR